jgi:hypothetical protein
VAFSSVILANFQFQPPYILYSRLIPAKINLVCGSLRLKLVCTITNVAYLNRGPIIEIDVVQKLRS